MSPIHRPGLQGAGVLLAAAGLAVAGSGMLFAPQASFASSHREAPLIATDGQVDGTDTYAFNSPDKPDSVTVLANFAPFQLPAGGPNFDPFGSADEARYNINIDTNGDALPDLTYRYTFAGGFKDKKTFLYNTGPVASLKDATLNFQQTYTVEVIGKDGSATKVASGIAAPANVGAASMPDYASLRSAAVASGAGKDGIRTFAGPADDPFFLDLRVFDLLYGANLGETGNATLSGLNVNSLALQVPKAVLAKTAGSDKSHVIGVWSTAERRALTTRTAAGTRSSSGAWVQVSRVGAPLVNEVVSSVALKDAFNALPPVKDHTVAGLVARVNVPEVPQLVAKIYKIAAPATPRKDLFSVFLTGVKGLNMPTKVTPAEMIRLNTSTPVTAAPNRLGVLAGDAGGFPNGRRLTDDVVDIELQTLEGALQPDGTVKLVQPLAKGDGVNANDVPFEAAFPYVALPHAGSTTGNGALGGTASSSASGTTPTPTGSVKAGGGGTASRLPLAGGAALLAGAALVGLAVLRRRQDSTAT